MNEKECSFCLQPNNIHAVMAVSRPSFLVRLVTATNSGDSWSFGKLLANGTYERKHLLIARAAPRRSLTGARGPKAKPTVEKNHAPATALPALSGGNVA